MFSYVLSFFLLFASSVIMAIDSDIKELKVSGVLYSKKIIELNARKKSLEERPSVIDKYLGKVELSGRVLRKRVKIIKGLKYKKEREKNEKILREFDQKIKKGNLPEKDLSKMFSAKIRMIALFKALETLSQIEDEKFKKMDTDQVKGFFDSSFRKFYAEEKAKAKQEKKKLERKLYRVAKEHRKSQTNFFGRGRKLFISMLKNPRGHLGPKRMARHHLRHSLAVLGRAPFFGKALVGKMKKSKKINSNLIAAEREADQFYYGLNEESLGFSTSI